MVPSDPENQLVPPPACTAETRPLESRGPDLCSTVPPLGDTASTLRPLPARELLTEASTSERSFARLQGVLAFQSHPGKVDAPDLSLRPAAECWINPFGSQLPSSTAISGSSGRFHVFKPVAYPITSSSPEPTPNRRSLSGFLALQIKAHGPFSVGKLALAKRPIPFSPRKLKLLIVASGSSIPVRYVLPGSLFL